MKHHVLCLLLPFFLVGIAIAEPFRFVEDNDRKQLFISDGTLPVLTYVYDAVEHENVPQRDLRRLAGCYVHPLHGLRGEILTDNAPADHYHHHGVFWTWPHVGVHEPDGKVTQYDLWTSNGPLKQHFVRWIDKTITDQSAIFEVENGWFVGNPQDGKKIMTERVKITVHRVQTVGDVPSRAVDFEFQWQPTDKPISLRGAEDKSYGGLTVRFKPMIAFGEREARRSDINRITVPAGIAEGDLPETPLQWADYTSLFPISRTPIAMTRDGTPIEGAVITHTPTPMDQLTGRLTQDFTVTLDGNPVEGARVSFAPSIPGVPSGPERRSGAAIFIPKTHPDFPPTWLTRYYGAMCVGWPGVKGQTFQPGEKIELRYRIWIHDGAVTVPQIEKAYEEYHEPRT